MMTTHDELEAKFQNKEISFEDYMETPVAQKPLEIKPSKLRGRRVAQRQGQMLSEQIATKAENLVSAFVAPFTNVAELPDDYTFAPGNLKTVEVAKRFILAGNAYLTVRSLASGTRYTFRVSKGEAKAGYCKWCRSNPCTCVQPHFVSYLAGPENSSDYVYLGWIKDSKFSTTKASARLADSQVFKAFRWVWEHLQNNQLPPKTEVWHEGRCGACGRKLTVPESIESGIGPVCAEKGGF